MNEELDGFDSPDWDIQRFLVWVSLGNPVAVNAAADGHPMPELAIQLTASRNARITERADIEIRKAFADGRVDCYAIHEGKLVKLDPAIWAALRIDYRKMLAFAPDGADQWQHLRVSSKQARAAFWNGVRPDDSTAPPDALTTLGVASSGAKPELPPPSQGGDKRPSARAPRGRPKGQGAYPGDDALEDEAILGLRAGKYASPYAAAKEVAHRADAEGVLQGQGEDAGVDRLRRRIKKRWDMERKSMEQKSAN